MFKTQIIWKEGKKKANSLQGAKIYAAIYFRVGYNNQNSFSTNYTESN